MADVKGDEQACMYDEYHTHQILWIYGHKIVNGSTERTTPSLSTQLRFILVINLTFGGCKWRSAHKTE